LGVRPGVLSGGRGALQKRGYELFRRVNQISKPLVAATAISRRGRCTVLACIFAVPGFLCMAIATPATASAAQPSPRSQPIPEGERQPPAAGLCRIDPGVRRRVDLSSSDRNAIDTCVSSLIAAMSEPESRRLREARSRLLEPLDDADASVPFRLTYADNVLRHVRPLVASQRDELAINAARILGELATGDSLAALELMLNDQREAVRFTAAAGFERAFNRVSRTAQPLVRADRVAAALIPLERIAATDPSPFVVDAAMQALAEATRLGTAAPAGAAGNFGAVRVDAVAAISRAAGAWAASCDASEAHALPILRGARAVRDALIQVGPNIQPLDRRTLTDAAGFAGDILTFARCRICDNCPAVDREALRTATTLAETILDRTSQGLGGPARTSRLAQHIERNEDDRFCQAVERLLSPNGELTSAPFNFPADRFKPCRR